MKKILVIVVAVILAVILLLPDVAFASPRIYTVSKSLVMYYYDNDYVNDCGPKSGVSIGWYYKTQVDRNYDGIKDYANLPSPQLEMFLSLHHYMGTDWFGATDPDNYGPGFAQMALNYNYPNFSFTNDFTITNDDGNGDGLPDDFKSVVDAINHGWPVSLEGCFANVDEISGDPPGGNDWPPGGFFCGHYIVIRGYSYKKITVEGTTFTWERRIFCTDNWCHANNLTLDWDNVVTNGLNLKTIIIRDQ